MERSFIIKCDDNKCFEMLKELQRLGVERKLSAALLGMMMTGHAPSKDQIILKGAGIEITEMSGTIQIDVVTK